MANAPRRPNDKDGFQTNERYGGGARRGRHGEREGRGSQRYCEGRRGGRTGGRDRGGEIRGADEVEEVGEEGVVEEGTESGEERGGEAGGVSEAGGRVGRGLGRAEGEVVIDLVLGVRRLCGEAGERGRGSGRQSGQGGRWHRTASSSPAREDDRAENGPPDDHGLEDNKMNGGHPERTGKPASIGAKLEGGRGKGGSTMRRRRRSGDRQAEGHATVGAVEGPDRERRSNGWGPWRGWAGEEGAGGVGGGERRGRLV